MRFFAEYTLGFADCFIAGEGTKQLHLPAKPFSAFRAGVLKRETANILPNDKGSRHAKCHRD
jgi:hypothetical protein